MALSGFGITVLTDPQAAHQKLVRLFVKHKQRKAVAEALGADQKTVQRWIEKIKAAGFADPRVEAAQDKRGDGVRLARKRAFTEAETREIKRRAKTESYGAIARSLGVATSTVSRAARDEGTYSRG